MGISCQMLTSEFCVFSLTEIVSGSVAGQISSDSSNVVELIEVSTRTVSYLHLYLLFTVYAVQVRYLSMCCL